MIIFQSNDMSEEKIKILIINYEFPPLGGGGGISSYDLAVEWAKSARVDVLTSLYKGLPSNETVDNINIFRSRVLMRKSRDAASFVSMLTYIISGFFLGLKLFKKNHYNIINTHFAVPSGPLGYVLGKMFKTPNVLSLHGGDIYDPSKKLSPHKSRIFRRVVNFILNHADRIVAQSNNTRNNAIKYYKPKKEIQIIPLAFHPPVLKKTRREEMGFNKDDFLLITIGRLVKRKAIDLMIKALSKINNNKIKLLIVGDGPEKASLEELVSSLSLDNRVVFTGFIDNDDKYRYLTVSDLFVLTSLHEGFGIVFMEAMYCGLPVVSTDNGGQVDFLRDEENALLIKVGDIEACANSILRYYKDKKLYRICSKNNKEKIKDFYAENVSARYTDLFKELI